MTQFIPSPEQQAIFDAVFNTSDNIAISALAGSGKTSTLVWIAKHLPASASKIFCAFNADIVQELQSKLNGTGVTARTFHSLGLGALKKYVNASELKPKDTKYRDLVNKWADSDGVFSLTLSEAVQAYKPEDRAEKLYQLRKDTLAMFVNLLNLTRVKLVEWNDIAGLSRLVYLNRLDVEIPHEELVDLVIDNVEYIMKQAEAETRKHNIDFTDMIYWAVRWNLNLYPYKYVLVDEAQDFNPMQREMIAKIIDPKGGRIILVGDPNQAIYAFAGADSDSFDLSVQRWNCKVLPLNMTRRCASVITQHAARLVPTFNCPPDKVRGKLVWLSEHDFESSVQLGDMVVSRVQAPLVKYCLALIAKGIPSVIKGKDMSKGFIALLDKLTKRRDYSFADLLKCLANYESEQVDIATKKNDDVAIETIRDQCSGLKFVIQAYPDVASITDLEEKIKNLFGDSKPNSDVVTFCTVHKSKGLEADRVFILAPDKMPLKSKDMTSEQLQQEWNLLYVAETRAKSVLVIVTTPKFLKDNAMPSYAQDDFEDKNWDAPLVAEPIIEAELGDESVPAYPSFATYFQEIISLMGTTRVLYASKGAVKMSVSRVALGDTTLNIQTISAEGESTHTAEMPETVELMQAFEPNLNHWLSVSVDEWTTLHNPAPVFESLYDKIVSEEKANWDNFDKLTEQLTALPANHGLFAVDGDTKMFVAPHIMHKGKFFVETVNGTYTQQVLSLDEALAQMEAFSPVPSTWNEISAKDWGFATAQHKTLAERRAEKADAPQPEPESAGFTNSIVHQALELIGENKGMYATANNAKMFITPLENRYVVKTIFSNGDDNNPVDTIEEALDLMFDFQPDANLWEVLSHDEWADKVNPTPLVEASEPPPFATVMHKRLNDLNGDYDPDTGLFADGATTTMYITTDMEDNFVVYERDYADEEDVLWSRERKTTNIVTLVSQMKAINPNADEWELGAWGDWTTREHLVDEPAPDTIRDMAIQMGGVITDAPQPETPSADALTISILASTLINPQFTQQQADELASEIHTEITPLLTFTDWTSANIATVKVVVKRLLRKANHLGYIEAIANAIAHFYQHGTLPLNPVIGEISEFAVWQNTQTIAKTNESSAVVDAMLPEPEPTDTPIETPQPVTAIVPAPVTPPADDTTFSNGENTPPYTNGKDHAASTTTTTPTPAPLPSTAPDVLKSLIDQFRPLELNEITLMIQALEHVRKEKTEGAGV